MNDARKPLRSRMLAVPSLSAKYLANVRAIAEDDLDWAKLGPTVAQYRKLIVDEVKADTRKLTTFEAFDRATADEPNSQPAQGRGSRMVLRTFADKRRTYLLNYAKPKPRQGDAGAKPERKEADR